VEEKRRRREEDPQPLKGGKELIMRFFILQRMISTFFRRWE